MHYITPISVHIVSELREWAAIKIHHTRIVRFGKMQTELFRNNSAVNQFRLFRFTV